MATQLPAEAAKTGYLPVQAEAELVATTALSAVGSFDEAVRVGRTAFGHALSAGYDEVLTMSAIRLAHVASRLQQNERGLEWTTLAESANHRARDAESAVMVENARGNIARNEGDFVGAALHYGRAMAEAKAKLGPEHMTTLGVSYNHASTLQNLGHFREATPEFAEVLSAARRTLGPKHPFINYPLVSSAEVALFRGELARARTIYDEVFELTGGKGVNAENALIGLGDVALAEGRYDDALRSLQAAHASQTARGPETVESLAGLAKQGVVFLRSGSPSEGARALRGRARPRQGRRELVRGAVHVRGGARGAAARRAQAGPGDRARPEGSRAAREDPGQGPPDHALGEARHRGEPPRAREA